MSEYTILTTMHVPQQPLPTATADMQRAFMERNVRQREAVEAKSLEEATALIRAQTTELNAAAQYSREVSAEIAELKEKLARMMPELRERMYSPLWGDIAPASQRYQPVPNRLWLVTSIALLLGGIWMVL